VNNPKSKIQNPKSLRRRLGAWFRQFGRDLPWRRTHDPYAILVSELMLQQTQVATVIPFFQRWMKRFPDFLALAAASEAEVLAQWQGLGYYARARNLHRAAQHVSEHHGGTLPDDPDAITALPGVGRYTAGAVASFAFDRPAAAVDANIARVLARLLNLREPIDSPRGMARVWELAEALLPRSGGRLHNSALMELGALLCTPRKPQCLLCPVREHCGAAAAGDPETIPVKKPRRPTIALEENCAWIVDGRRVLLERQTGSRWRGLWKLPRLPAPPQREPLLRAEYPFTHHRVSLRVFAASPPAELSENQGWFDADALRGAALPSPHRRAVEQLWFEAHGANEASTSPAKNPSSP
jgi:A/G-specific adenine glycosylase